MILSGGGRYADPWHDFDRTSTRLAEILEGAGFAVGVRADPDEAVHDLDDVSLLVVNSGDPWSGADPAPPTLAAGRTRVLGDVLARGIGVVGIHASVASLRDYPDWAAAAGAIWLPEASFHPTLGTTRIRLGDAPLVAGLGDFDIRDERYCRLQWVGAVTVVATHEGVGGVPEPAVWVREYANSRIAMDVLGHDVRSYDSPGHVALLQRVARWAARADAPG